MNFQYLFYIIGIVFLFATISYFAYNYLFDLSDSLKTVILILVIIVFFVLGELMEDKNF
jgi:drug/metabolite transporter (DMT)-like permease